ncbi:MAG: PIN domain-containing protein [Nanoarchaeota archaeon]
MRFIDSNVLAYAFYDNKNRERCQEIIMSGGCVNTVNLIEAYNIIQFETNQEYATKSIRSLLKSNLNIIDVDINLIFETLKRTLKYKKLKFIDLLHYITSLLHNCDEIASYDTDFDGLEIKRVC